MSAAREASLRELAGALPAVVEGRRFDAPPAETLSRVVYIDCSFERVHWRQCRFKEARFVNCRFETNRFERCVWHEMGCADSQFIDCVWEECELERVGWQRVIASGAQWRGGRQRDFFLRGIGRRRLARQRCSQRARLFRRLPAAGMAAARRLLVGQRLDTQSAGRL
ncbi:pentapeptide repeat-containing protein [Chromobacterium haemolyticum]|nr:pentapeptide repeat-containing protein [Chromobacterium haemolyticum]